VRRAGRAGPPDPPISCNMEANLGLPPLAAGAAPPSYQCSRFAVNRIPRK